MSFNVGNGLLTAHIDLQRLHKVKAGTLLPEMNLWEKIKQFFCSTQQGDALKCIHKLYHHESLNMTEENIRDTFIELRCLASPGCRNKFVIERSNTDNIYKINDEIILSFPRAPYNDLISHDDDIWYDCEDLEDERSDCINERPLECPETQVLQSELDIYTIISTSRCLTTEQIQDELDSHFFACLEILKPKIKKHIATINKYKASYTIGPRGILNGTILLTKINNNLFDKSKPVDMIALRKNIAEVLKIPRVMDYIPPDIIETPDYKFVVKHCNTVT